jgi:uncharacterized membrane protein
MALILAYLLVFILAATPFFEVISVIPLGALAGMNAPAVALIAFIGNMATILLLILLIDRIKLWLQRRKDRKGVSAEGKREKRAAAIWKKYGLPGLALISPITVGSHLGAIMAMSFGGTRRQITVWMTVSILVWTVAAGALAHFGVNLFFEQTGREGLLVSLLQAGQ